MKYFFLVWGIVILGDTVFAQDTLKVAPGDMLIDGSFIEPYTNQWEVFVQTPEGQETHFRYWTDYVHILNQDGSSLLHRVQDIYGSDRVLQSTWINVVDHRTLLPKRFTAHTPLGVLIVLDFGDGRIVSGSNQNEERTFSSDTVRVDMHYFDWNLYGMLLVGLPFKVGKTYELPYWSAQIAGETSVFATIGEPEEVASLSGSGFMTYPVSTSDGFTFSLTKEAPYVIKLVWDLPNGNKMIWKKV